MTDEIQKRKQAHLETCLNPCTFGNGSDLCDVHLPYDALFEISEEELDTHTDMAGFRLSFPLMFGAMTGGTSSAASFNTALRRLARHHHLAMCLGSIRAYLNDSSLKPTYGEGRTEALFANIGASEIENASYSAQTIAKACEELGCSGLFIHLNGLQECVQDGGNHHFSCAFDTLATFCRCFPMPIFIKEVGSGIGGKCAEHLAQLPIAGLETAARGGTSWVRIEAYLKKKSLSESSIQALDSLGYGQKESIRSCRHAMGTKTVIASGGIANPLLLIQSLFVGADLAAVSRPIFEAYHTGGEQKLTEFISEFIDVSKIVWRSTGAKNLRMLQNAGQLSQ